MAGEGPGARGIEVAWPRAAHVSEYALDEGDGCKFVEGRGWYTGQGFVSLVALLPPVVEGAKGLFLAGDKRGRRRWEEEGLVQSHELFETVFSG